VANGERTWRLDKGWRAREIRNGGRRKTKPLAYEVVKRFANACEQIAVLEKLCEGRLDLNYLEWNGLTNPPTVC
jgi:hypothetical protein